MAPLVVRSPWSARNQRGTRAPLILRTPSLSASSSSVLFLATLFSVSVSLPFTQSIHTSTSSSASVSSSSSFSSSSSSSPSSHFSPSSPSSSSRSSSASVSTSSSASAHTTLSSTLLPPPNLIGSGLRLRFPGKANQSYCILTGSCLHVNALMAGILKAPNKTWVKGYGMRIGGHTLILKTVAPFLAHVTPSVSFTLDGQKVKLGRGSKRVLKSADDKVRVERWGIAEGAYLISARKCGIRLLVFAKKGWTWAYPRLSFDVLDWDRLHSPNGILGQKLRNKATLDNDEEFEMQATSVTQNGIRPLKKRQLLVSEAIRRLYSIKHRDNSVVGAPDDYVTSGDTKTDCQVAQRRVPASKATSL